MVFAKNRSRVMIVGASMLALLFFAGCKKLKTKDPIIFDISAVMPHDGTPIAGVRYKIVEMKYKSKFGKVFGESSPTGWELNGLTDNQGKASGNFKGVFKTNYSYFIYFDYTAMQLPSGIDNYVVDGPEYALLQRSSPESNSYEVRVIPKMPVQFRFKNTACVNQQDTFRYKSKNIEEKPNGNIDGYDWLEGPSLNGCVDIDGEFLSRLAGHYVFKWEAVRGGDLSEGIDTFYVFPGGNNVVNMEW